MPNIPNGIAILSGIASSRGWETEYFDTCSYEKKNDRMDDQEIMGALKPSARKVAELHKFQAVIEDTQKKIDTFKPKVIAISCMTFEYEFLLSFWDEIDVPADTIIAIGGFHSIIKGEEVITSGKFDFCCITEAEGSFARLLRQLENDGPINSIEGSYHCDRKTGEITRNSKGKLMQANELWEAVPDFTMFDDSYFQYPFDGNIYRRYGIEISRGCPYDCTYCGNTALKAAFSGMGKFIRVRPVSSLIESMKVMIDKQDIELFYFQDDCYLAHPQAYLEELAERYAKEIRKPFIVTTRPETITESRVEILKSMGAPFFQVSLGVETGSPEILKTLCSRNTPNEQLIDAFELLHEHDIRTAGFFMLGFPHETREQIFETINLCRRVKPTVSIVSIFQPLPGQRLTDIAIEAGFISGEESLLNFTEGSILRMPQISAEEISNIFRVFNLYAYLPDEYYPAIEKCEKDFKNNKALYEKLVQLRWEHASMEKIANPKTGRLSGIETFEAESHDDMNLFHI